MKKVVMLLALFMITSVGMADTLAWIRFDNPEAADGQIVPHGASAGIYAPDILDVSGNGNHFSVWMDDPSSGAKMYYRTNVALPQLPSTRWSNTHSIRHGGNVPLLWCNKEPFKTISPATFTIEAIFKLQNCVVNAPNKVIVGRDSYRTCAADSKLFVLYLMADGGATSIENRLAIKFCDVSGYWHEAISAPNVYTGFTSTNYDGIGVPCNLLCPGRAHRAAQRRSAMLNPPKTVQILRNFNVLHVVV